MSDADWFSLGEIAEEVSLASKNGNTPDEPRPWLIDAADLLAEDDPGPTPWLVEDMIVDGAIIAAVGRWKTTKSYGLLDLCISIAAGEPAFGEHTIPIPGPVVFVNEESGRAALWRRLDSLCRGRRIDPERLRGRLMLGANARVKLDDARWQEELIQLGLTVAPRMFVFDPLARMKAAGREENAQTDMAPLIEFMRLLRQETGAAVCFVHHTGHIGEQMRGSSDLESMWETRLTWKRDGQSPTITVTSEHREAESSEPVVYQIRFDADERTMRFAAVEQDGAPILVDRIVAELEAHADHGLTTDEVRMAVNVRRSDVVRTLESMEVAGTAYRMQSGYRDGLGRHRRHTVWKAGQKEIKCLYDNPSHAPDDMSPGVDTSSHRPTTLEWGGTDEQPDAVPEDAISEWFAGLDESS